ncbi:hypothetical protein TCON_2296 [Astathelohania contejeani]|uniref:Uncharacterized protein n=1 Tax=Astathelohania contejeani TaxID=164912 RepID=A0ABQ7HWD6_9MICR|nr:hypothetical protein TCON_2296 [Thelohania contejeani]
METIGYSGNIIYYTSLGRTRCILIDNNTIVFHQYNSITMLQLASPCTAIIFVRDFLVGFNGSTVFLEHTNVLKKKIKFEKGSIFEHKIELNSYVRGIAECDDILCIGLANGIIKFIELNLETFGKVENHKEINLNHHQPHSEYMELKSASGLLFVLYGSYIYIIHQMEIKVIKCFSNMSCFAIGCYSFAIGYKNGRIDMYSIGNEWKLDFNGEITSFLDKKIDKIELVTDKFAILTEKTLFIYDNILSEIEKYNSDMFWKDGDKIAYTYSGDLNLLTGDNECIYLLNKFDRVYPREDKTIIGIKNETLYLFTNKKENDGIRNDKFVMPSPIKDCVRDCITITETAIIFQKGKFFCYAGKTLVSWDNDYIYLRGGDEYFIYSIDDDQLTGIGKLKGDIKKILKYSADFIYLSDCGLFKSSNEQVINVKSEIKDFFISQKYIFVILENEISMYMLNGELVGSFYLPYNAISFFKDTLYITTKTGVVILNDSIKHRNINADMVYERNGIIVKRDSIFEIYDKKSFLEECKDGLGCEQFYEDLLEISVKAGEDTNKQDSIEESLKEIKELDMKEKVVERDADLESLNKNTENLDVIANEYSGLAHDISEKIKKKRFWFI